MEFKIFLLVTFVMHIIFVAHAAHISITPAENDEECQTKWSTVTLKYVNAIYRADLRQESKITQKIRIGRW